MANNYQFLDAYSSVQTAASSVVSGAHQQIVQIGSVLTPLAVTIASNPATSVIQQGTWSVSVQGSVTALQGTNPWIITGSIQTANASVSGTVDASQIGAWRVSILSSIPSSMLVGASIIGLTPVNVSNFPTTQNVSGSVVATQGTTPWAVTNVGSIISLNVGSVITVSKDSSVISRNAPIASWVSGTADFRSNTGASVAVVAAAGANISNYITGVQVANYGPASVLVTLAGAPNGGSILGYTIAPIGGGSNIVYANPLKTGANTPFTASINGVSSVLVSAQGFTA